MFDFGTVKEVRLSKGNHDSPGQGMCFMEMAAWFAGEEHSDKPECVSPSLGHLGIAINDSMEDGVRDRLLKPMIPHVVGTADDSAETARAEYICLRAFNYVVGMLSPEFVRRYRGARSYGEAQSMAGHLYDVMRYRRSDYDISKMSYMPMIDPLVGDRTRARLFDAVRAMVERRSVLTPFPAAAEIPLTYENVSAATHPNLANVQAAGGVFSLMGEIIPDWSAAVDTLREAIKLGRHDGFDVVTDLEARHIALRELVDA